VTIASSGLIPANMLSIRPSGCSRPRSRPKLVSNSASEILPISKARSSAIASGSVPKRCLTAFGSSPSERQKSAKLSQTEVVRTPPKSKTTAAYAPDDMGQQATEAPEGIDRAGVEGWFEANVPEVDLPLSFDRISGGRSNMTFGVRDAAGHAWALRRPPLGKRLGSAHDMGREHRVIAALQDTPVPVPPVIGLCEDESVNEAPFYVMGFVDGPILRSAEDAKAFDEDERRAIGERVVDTLVRIHEVDPDTVGLGDLGRKEAYVERQLKRWQGQWEKSKTRELPAVDSVHERLSARVPEQGPATIVHGDYRLDNMILSPSGEVAAVVDWELCTLGDPLADVGMLLVYWSEEGDDFMPLFAPATIAPGFPKRDDVRERYAERSGRDLSQIDFFIALGYWKLAIILEGVYARYASGQYGETDEGFQDFAKVVERLADAADEAANRLP
jgi:aminoglycoside phosphotransferase (APT) family kinase protein